jgi:two-component system, chemotaxis family, CheB/CheR fusion protein
MRPYLTTEKKIDGVVMSFLDINDVIQSKINTDESRQFAESVLETINEPLLVLDADLRAIMSNRAFYQLFKVKPNQVLKKPVYEIGHGQLDIPEFKQALETSRSTGKASAGLIVNGAFPEIGKRILSINIMQLSSKDRKETLITAEDITEIKQLEEQQIEQRKNLEKKLESAEHLAVIGQTAGMVGHDIRNPIQAIVSAVYLAKDDLVALPQSEIKQSLIESMREIEDQAS